MTDSPRMSRREWFRLYLPKPQPAPASSESAMGRTSEGLRELELPVNHDGMDLSQLPPMREALLDTEQVAQLFADLAAFATDIHLIQRSSPASRGTPMATATPKKLQSARQALLSGTIPRLQLRYQWSGQHWIDTLEAKPDGYRLVRIMHTLPATKSNGTQSR
ncbi:MAG: hypothetical protein CMJ46_12195 [Planctomyces sp.]|nr:hypothetical protein [Planctomyces sp.]